MKSCSIMAIILIVTCTFVLHCRAVKIAHEEGTVEMTEGFADSMDQHFMIRPMEREVRAAIKIQKERLHDFRRFF